MEAEEAEEERTLSRSLIPWHIYAQLPKTPRSGKQRADSTQRGPETVNQLCCLMTHGVGQDECAKMKITVSS